MKVWYCWMLHKNGFFGRGSSKNALILRFSSD